MEKSDGLEYRRRYRGLIGVNSKVPLRDRAVLSLVYTPGVAEACLAIQEDPARIVRPHLPRQHGRPYHRRLRPLRPPGWPARIGHPHRRRQERSVQDVCRSRCLPALSRYPGYDRDHRSRHRHGPDLWRDLYRRISTRAPSPSPIIWSARPILPSFRTSITAPASSCSARSSTR